MKRTNKSARPRVGSLEPSDGRWQRQRCMIETLYQRSDYSVPGLIAVRTPRIALKALEPCERADD